MLVEVDWLLYVAATNCNTIQYINGMEWNESIDGWRFPALNFYDYDLLALFFWSWCVYYGFGIAFSCSFCFLLWNVFILKNFNERHCFSLKFLEINHLKSNLSKKGNSTHITPEIKYPNTDKNMRMKIRSIGIGRLYEEGLDLRWFRGQTY